MSQGTGEGADKEHAAGKTCCRTWCLSWELEDSESKVARE